MLNNIAKRRTPGRVSARGLVASTALVALTAVCASLLPAPRDASAADRRPIYAIAHRVNTLEGVSDAIQHGANAIEIDVCPWWNPNEWRAWHDCSSAGNNRRGPSLDSIFGHIVAEAQAGRRLALVWLDIKAPNYCGRDQNRACSVAGLHDEAQKLTAAGIQVLYGFYEYHGGTDVGGRGWQSLQNQLGPLEGITTTGSLATIQRVYARHGAGLPVGRRVMDDGNSDISKQFGNCTEARGSRCTGLKNAGKYRDAGNLAATLSWTTTYNDPWYIDKLLGDAGVDGIIAGYGEFNGVKDYDGSWECENSIALIRDWVNRHSSTHRMATSGDRMFR